MPVGRAAMVAALLALGWAPGVRPAHAQFPIREAFTGSTAPGWLLGEEATLTAGTLDPIGDGWLRLTPDTAFSKGFAVYDTAFPSDRGVAFVFDFAMWRGTGADGICFFLFDGAIASSSFRIGDFGGSMGYANGCEVPGVSGGYLGVGFDVFGNFSSPADRCKSGGPGFSPDSIVVRGSGSGTTGYRYLVGRTGLPGSLDFDAATERPDSGGADLRRAFVFLTPDGRLTVQVQFGRGESRHTVVDGLDVFAAAGQAALPPTLKLGFAAATGASTNIHEVRTLEIAVPVDLEVTKTAGESTVVAGSRVTWTVGVANRSLVEVRGATLRDLVPEGVEDVTWTCTTTAGSAVSAGAGTGRDIRLTLDLLSAGEAELVIEGRAGIDIAGDLSNTASVTSPAEYEEIDLGDNEATDTTRVLDAGQGATLVLEATDEGGGALLPGDTLLYTAMLTVAGAEELTAATIRGAIPPWTTYVPGSSTVAGATVPDVDGASALVGGVAVSTPGDPEGELHPGGTVVLSFRAQVDATAPGGTAIPAQLVLSTRTRSGEPRSDLPSDDPATAAVRDPTVVVVGGGPSVATISGVVYEDLDHDRTVGVTDPRLPGWTVRVVRSSLAVASTVSQGDGSFFFGSLEPGDGYTIEYVPPGATGAFGTSDTLTLVAGESRSDVDLPVDPTGVVYDAVTREPVEGAVVWLRGPTGFRPEEHLLADQQGQTVGPDGRYRFILVGSFPPGEYRLDVDPPSGWSSGFPSERIPAETATLNLASVSSLLEVVPGAGAPPVGSPTTWYRSFWIEPGDQSVVNNHVPLDPTAGPALRVTKTCSLRRASRGDLVPFTIRLRNARPSAVGPISVLDRIPAGFTYVEGSLRGPDGPVTVEANGRDVSWSAGSLAAEEERAYRLILLVGGGVAEGRHVNRAEASHVSDGSLRSNTAEAALVVEEDPTFDASDLIGRVFDDLDGDGYLDPGEPGLPGVRLATARGWVITTDEHGRYHVAAAAVPDERRGSNFIVKLDTATLPSGYRLTSENPRVVRLTRGKISRANFGVRRKAEDGPSPPPPPPSPSDARTPSGPPRRIDGPTRPAPFSGVRRDFSDVLRRPPPADASAIEGLLEVPPELDERGRPLRVIEDGRVTHERREMSVRPLSAEASAIESVRVSIDYRDFGWSRTLNVLALPRTAVLGSPVRFRVHCNYPDWISRAEVRVFASGRSVRGDPLARLPVDPGGEVIWTPERSAGDEVRYVLRVYDAKERFDETAPRRLPVVPVAPVAPPGAAEEGGESEWLTLLGEDRTAISGIPLFGGSVRVHGRNVPAGYEVRVGDDPVPVDARGRFVTERILSSGPHEVRVVVRPPGGQGLLVRRSLYIADDRWFWVGLADLTLGGYHGDTTAAIESGHEGADDDLYVNGRVAFYLKGKVRGEYLLTASLDTREEDLENILGRLSERDPRRLLRRIDPDRYYPVYGDDSTLVEDAPTQGRFYVRLERGESHVLWGNYSTGVLETELAQVDRSLYGAKVHWVSDDSTRHGERRTRVDAFAASPDTHPAREEFRGTGGSLYWLRNTDLVTGSERVRVEVRDRDSGIVSSVRELRPREDYDIDYFQGRILLTRPLASTADDGLAVDTGSLSGHPVFLVVRYDHVPLATDVDDFVGGGRASHWFGDHVEVGVSGSHQEVELGDQELMGADVTLRLSPTTYLKAELGRSEGPGAGEQRSMTGGFVFDDLPWSAERSNGALAWRVEGASDLSELVEGGGDVSLFVEERQGGFSAPGRVTARDSRLWGLRVAQPLGEDTRVTVKYDEVREDQGLSRRAVNADLDWDIWGGLYTKTGARHDRIETGSAAGSVWSPRVGSRTDVALRLGYRVEKAWDLYGFVQGTVDRTRDRSPNNRYGLGAEARLTDRIGVAAEVSGGSGGLGTRVSGGYEVTDRTHLYLAYQLDTDRTDTALPGTGGTFTTGMRTRFTDSVSVYGEERVLHGDGPSGLTHAYGVDLAPSDAWNLGVAVENGVLSDALSGEYERLATSLSVGTRLAGWTYGGAIEWRQDRGSLERRSTWLLRNNLGYRLHPDWRVLSRLNLSFSDSSRGAYQDGDFTEAVLGLAYRPVAHDRVHCLLKYTYFQNLPSPGQVDATGGAAEWSQRSHVLSVDGMYDLFPWLTVGGKYGLRIGELRTDRTTGEWFRSVAHLGVLRADWHFVREWDLLLEGRALWVEEARNLRLGALVGVYRHVGDHFKIGGGYSFADFSDDLTDLSYDQGGWFINVVGKI